MLTLPFFDELKDSQTILLAGAGGGFDIFSGLPLYFGLRAAGKTVHLANFSFSFLPPPQITGEKRLSPSVVKVTSNTPNYTDYFPELYLSKWFKEQGWDVPVYCFESPMAFGIKLPPKAPISPIMLPATAVVNGQRSGTNWNKAPFPAPRAAKHNINMIVVVSKFN